MPRGRHRRPIWDPFQGARSKKQQERALGVGIFDVNVLRTIPLSTPDYANIPELYSVRESYIWDDPTLPPELD